MTLHPQAKVVLDQLASLQMPALWEVSAEEARENSRARRVMPENPEQVHDVQNRSVPGPGGDIPVRIYRSSAAGDHPLLVWYHGGGWVIGDLDMADPSCRALANHAGAVVVSVDYRLAPEHRFPAAIDDCYAATVWAVEHAAELGADPARVAVGGDSAGGNLAAAVALRARDESGPAIGHQLLVYPVIERNFGTASYRDNAEGYLLTKQAMEWFWDHYMGPGGDDQSPYVAPIKAKSLAGLPPALVITAEYDPLRDEGEAYAKALEAAGVPVTCTRYAGQIHGFFGMGGVLDDADKAVEQAGQAVKAALA